MHGTIIGGDQAIFDLIAAHRIALEVRDLAFIRIHGVSEEVAALAFPKLARAVAKAERRAFAALVEDLPVTLAGTAAMILHLRDAQSASSRTGMWNLDQADTDEMFDALDRHAGG